MAKVHNLAYELPDDVQEEAKVERKIKHKANALAVTSKKAAVGWGFLLLVVLALMASMIFGKVEISSLYTQRAELEAQLTQLTNENVSLQSELAQRTNMTTVEEYAENNLGLQKLDKSQIEYVEVETESTAEITAEENQNIFVKIKNWFVSAMEYIGL